MTHRWVSGLRSSALALAAAALLAPVSAAATQSQGERDERADINLSFRLDGLEDGRVTAGRKVEASGRIKPFVKGEKVSVRLLRDGKAIEGATTPIKAAKGGKKGRFTLQSDSLLEPGRYQFVATKRASQAQGKASGRSKAFGIDYPDLDPGQSNESVGALRRLLRREGYYAPGGEDYNDHLSRAVLAFRKVNGMERSTNATPEIFKKLASGKGGFKLAYPGSGHHVEVDISRQVMVLADDGEPQHIFHISSGAAATPSDYGSYRFYRKDPGFNSLGMYYSVYYNRGEATHGYHSVPTYPASHGCIRNPIPDSVFIYNWIDIGDPMHVYP